MFPPVNKLFTPVTPDISEKKKVNEAQYLWCTYVIFNICTFLWTKRNRKIGAAVAALLFFHNLFLINKRLEMWRLPARLPQGVCSIPEDDLFFQCFPYIDSSATMWLAEKIDQMPKCTCTSPHCRCLPLAAGLCAVTAAVHFQFCQVDITLFIHKLDFLFNEHGCWHTKWTMCFFCYFFKLQNDSGVGRKVT